MEEAIAQWREESDLRAKCNEQWKLCKTKFSDLVDAIKGEVSEDTIHCMKYVSRLPNDCGEILAIDSYSKHLPARILLSEILDTFARNGDYMTLVKLFIVEMVRKQW